jgi:hypothetical protein
MENIKRIGGSREVGIIHIKGESSQSKQAVSHMFLLAQNKKNPIFVSSLVLMVNQDKIAYIRYLDTTGCFLPRDEQSVFTKVFVRESLRALDPTFISLFSQPKPELVFGKSGMNKEKRILRAGRLLGYWESIFSSLGVCSNQNSRNLHVYSKYREKKSFPYPPDLSLEDIYLFGDDPKEKMMKSVGRNVDIGTFYESLLGRSDFNKGSLVYSVCGCKTHDKCIDDRKDLAIISDVEEMINFLRELDFSDRAHALDSTKMFNEAFKIQLDFFNTDNKEIEKTGKVEENVVVLKTRKRQAGG